MQMVYNSDSYVVVQLDVPASDDEVGRGGFEIVDKFAKQDVYIEGALAASFKAGVQALIDSDPSPDAFDEFISGYAVLARQPLTLH
jgi:hypothetical protein